MVVLKFLATRKLWHLLATGIVVSLVFLGNMGARAASPLVRDVIVAMYAHSRAGEAMPFPDGEPDRTMGETFKPETTWGIETNSRYLTALAVDIIPFLVVEQVSAGIYPRAVVVIPFPAERSFVVAGTMGERVVALNQRYLEDQRDVLAVITHELIHVQGGNFLEAPGGEWRSYFIESRTQSATVEVLAAMCRFGNEVACGAFWGDIESLARRSLQAKAIRAGVPWAYNLWVDIFLRDASERAKGEKMDRFWAPRRLEQREIAERYGELPWQEQILPGICGELLQTGNVRYLGTFGEDRPLFLVLAMPFDDTRAEMGAILATYLCLTNPPIGVS